MVQTLSAVLHDERPRLDALAAVQRIVKRCLAKEPEQRFQSMADVRTLLEQLRAKPDEARPSVAVLPFCMIGGDRENQYFSDGLTEGIINALAQNSGFECHGADIIICISGEEAGHPQNRRGTGCSHYH
jgi:hypothetical protein